MRVGQWWVSKIADDVSTPIIAPVSPGIGPRRTFLRGEDKKITTKFGESLAGWSIMIYLQSLLPYLSIQFRRSLAQPGNVNFISISHWLYCFLFLLNNRDRDSKETKTIYPPCAGWWLTRRTTRPVQRLSVMSLTISWRNVHTHELFARIICSPINRVIWFSRRQRWSAVLRRVNLTYSYISLTLKAPEVTWDLFLMLRRNSIP